MLKFILLTSANDGKHKYLIVLEDATTGKIHKVKFGSLGYQDFLTHLNEERKANYIKRHRVREDWTDPLKPGTLSRFILWNKPTLKASVDDYLKRFNILQLLK